MTPSPRWQWLISAARFDCVPDGKKSASSKPKISAARACRRLTVGASPKTSSPSSASIIARRIPAPGRGTGSERRSTITFTLGIIPVSFGELLLQGRREKLVRLGFRFLVGLGVVAQRQVEFLARRGRLGIREGMNRAGIFHDA